MTKFFWVSILLNVIGVILLYVFLIWPHWYFGLSHRPQLIMEISLVMMVIGQIFVAFISSKKFNGNVLVGSIPIIIPIWYYFVIVRPLIIAYM